LDKETNLDGIGVRTHREGGLHGESLQGQIFLAMTIEAEMGKEGS